MMLHFVILQHVVTHHDLQQQAGSLARGPWFPRVSLRLLAAEVDHLGRRLRSRCGVGTGLNRRARGRVCARSSDAGPREACRRLPAAVAGAGALGLQLKQGPRSEFVLHPALGGWHQRERFASYGHDVACDRDARRSADRTPR